MVASQLNHRIILLLKRPLTHSWTSPLKVVWHICKCCSLQVPFHKVLRLTVTGPRFCSADSFWPEKNNVRSLELTTFQLRNEIHKCNIIFFFVFSKRLSDVFGMNLLIHQLHVALLLWTSRFLSVVKKTSHFKLQWAYFFSRLPARCLANVSYYL